MAGNLDEIRDSSRAAVHEQFMLPVIVYGSEGSPLSEVHARLHAADSRPFGDLDREGYAFEIEGKNIAVFDEVEWAPQEGQILDFGRGRIYHIDHVIDNKIRTRYQRCILTEAKLP